MTTQPKKTPGKAVAIRKTTAPTKKAVPATAAAKPATTEAVTVDLSQRVEAARAMGFSRKFLTDESGLTGTTALWRTNRMGETEAAKLAVVLVKIENSVIVAPERRVAANAGPTKAELAHKLDEAAKLLATAKAEKTIAGARKLIGETLDLLGGTS
jgi:hypothetical protein